MMLDPDDPTATETYLTQFFDIAEEELARLRVLATQEITSDNLIAMTKAAVRGSKAMDAVASTTKWAWKVRYK